MWIAARLQNFLEILLLIQEGNSLREYPGPFLHALVLMLAQGKVTPSRMHVAITNFNYIAQWNIYVQRESESKVFLSKETTRRQGLKRNSQN